MKKQIYLGFMLSLLLLLPLFALAGKTKPININSIEAAAPAINQAILSYGANHVLLLFDIDNTLLTTPQGYNLASTQWWDWQMALLHQQRSDACLAANNITDLVATENQLMALTDEVPTEPQIVTYVNHWQQQGIKAIVLTARDHHMFDASQRQLAKVGLNFKKSEINNKQQPNGIAGTFSRHHLTSVKYTDGIAMMAGQNKGEMLLYLLDHYRLQHQFKAVFFFDDKMNNVTDVIKAADNSPTFNATLYSYHYNKVYPRYQAFMSSPTLQQLACQRYQQLQKALTVFG